MNILKKGKKIIKTIKRTCEDCGCCFEFGRFETTLCDDGSRHIFCPNCGEALDIELSAKEQVIFEKW